MTDDPALRQATTELRTLLERFANGQSISGIENATRALYTDAQNDQELRAWFGELDEYVRKVRFSIVMHTATHD